MEVGVYQAKANFSKLLERVEAGEEVTITRHGKPVAQMHAPAPPSSARRTPEEVQSFMARVAAFRAQVRASGGGASIEEIIAWKNEGRE